MQEGGIVDGLVLKYSKKDTSIHLCVLVGLAWFGENRAVFFVEKP
jgi:hypothetical protein